MSNKGKTQSFDDVKRQLAEEDHAKLVGNQTSVAENSPSAFVIEGLRIEELQ